jgi:hypothetical protein
MNRWCCERCLEAVGSNPEADSFLLFQTVLFDVRNPVWDNNPDCLAFDLGVFDVGVI